MPKLISRACSMFSVGQKGAQCPVPWEISFRTGYSCRTECGTLAPMMKTLPTHEELRSALQGLNHAELNRLADAGQVPFPTLMKIRQGTTEDPRLSTVQRILANLPRKAKRTAQAEATHG